MMRRILSVLAAGLLSFSLVADVLGVTVNGIDVSAGSGVDWNYTNPTLTLSGTGPFVLHGTNTAGTVRVKVDADSTVVLSNLHLKADRSSWCAFQITGDKNVKLLLVGDNELKSGTGCSGLQVESRASVRVLRDSTGRLVASGGLTGAGIGGKSGGTSGDIYINGGRITAKGGDVSAGIGGTARRGSAGKIVVTGGTVSATAGSNADDIGAGAGGQGAVVAIIGGSVFAANGSINNSPTNALGVQVHCVTVTGLVANAAVELEDLGDYGGDGIFADDEGQVYLWLTNGVYRFQANNCAFRAEVVDGPTTAEMLPQEEQPIGVFVNGADIGLNGSGEGWEFAVGDLELSLAGTGPFIVSGTNTLSGLKIATSVDVLTQVKFMGFVSAELQFKGPLEIVGGTVVATEAQGPLIITGGSVTCGDFAVEPSNGVERVWCVTVPNLTPNAAVEVTGLADYGTEGLVADASGCLYLWLPDGDYVFEANGSGVRAIVEGADAVAVPLPTVTLTGVTVNGVDVAYEYGPGWTYAAPLLSLTNTYEYVLSGTNESIQISIEANVQVVLSDLVLTSRSTYPFDIASECEAVLVLSGTNQLKSTILGMPGLRVPTGASCVINSSKNGSGGCLFVVGGAVAAGMGGSYSSSHSGTGRIEINGGTIIAEMGLNGDSDIGGGLLGAGGEVVISGGSVKATNGIENAPVNVQGTAVHCVTVTNLTPNAAVTVTGLGDYGVDGLVADELGQIYLWLPDGEKAFTAGGRKFVATVDGSAVTAVDQGPATEVVFPTELVVTSFNVSNGVAQLVVGSNLSATDFAAWLETVSFEIDFRMEIGGAITKLNPTCEGASLSVTLPADAKQGFLTVRAVNKP